MSFVKFVYYLFRVISPKGKDTTSNESFNPAGHPCLAQFSVQKIVWHLRPWSALEKFVHEIHQPKCSFMSFFIVFLRIFHWLELRAFAVPFTFAIVRKFPTKKWKTVSVEVYGLMIYGETNTEQITAILTWPTSHLNLSTISYRCMYLQ